MFTTLIRPSVQRSIDLISAFVDAANEINTAVVEVRYPLSRYAYNKRMASLDLVPQYAEAALSASMPNTEMPRWAVLVDTSVKRQDEVRKVTRWCDCEVSYVQPADVLAPVKDLTVHSVCGWYHRNRTEALRDLQTAMSSVTEGRQDV